VTHDVVSGNATFWRVVASYLCAPRDSVVARVMLARLVRLLLVEATLMFGKFSLLPQLWRSARLTLRLLRDSRVPLMAKLVFYATVVYVLSPFDFAPDWIPVLGQADDLVAILAGLNLFFRACPSAIVQEHEAEIDGRLTDGHTEAGRRARVSDPIEGQYRRMA
jgi:uncharacterized membrane protein YkvA (DUF1232 family)